MTNHATVPLYRPGVSLPASAAEPRRRWLAPAPAPAVRRRPRIVYAAVAIGGIAIIALVQLLLTIGLSDGAYQVTSLQNDQKDLARTNQSSPNSSAPSPRRRTSCRTLNPSAWCRTAIRSICDCPMGPSSARRPQHRPTAHLSRQTRRSCRIRFAVSRRRRGPDPRCFERACQAETRPDSTVAGCAPFAADALNRRTVRT